VIVGYHVIFGTYGFWLPNDPRGSWSEFVGSFELFRHGRATKTDARHSLADVPHDHSKRSAAKEDLRYPAVYFTDDQIEAVGLGFGNYVAKSQLSVWACAVMPDHVHLVVGRHRLTVEKFVIQLKGAATEQLKVRALHPLASFADESGTVPKCFARGEWKVFLDEDDIERTVEYVEQNPVKDGRPRQRWSFVKPVDWFAKRN
jgi:REP element-mobilizing transposase RayT